MGLNRRAAAYGQAVSDETITVGATVETLTVPANVQSALITASGNNVRYRYGVSDPTAGVGHLILDGGNIEIFEPDLSEVGFIAASGTPTLFVTYFREV